MINSVKTYHFNLYDLHWQYCYAKGYITDKITQINMQKLQSATYFINILQDHKRVKSFKVIKAE